MKFHELKPGAEFFAGPRSVSESEIIEFARRYDPQLFHVDPEAATAGRWGGIIASGWMTCSIAMELTVKAVLAGSDSIGSPGVEKLEWEHPTRPGDALTLRITVLESRISSTGALGIIRWRWELSNQHRVRVLNMVATSFFDVAGDASNRKSIA